MKPSEGNDVQTLLLMATADGHCWPLMATDVHLVAACRYDTDGSGEIDKSELFEMCLTVGQVIVTDCH